MGLNLKYTAGKREFSIRLAANEVRILQALAERGLETAANEVIDVGDFGKAKAIERRLLLDAVTTILTALEREKELLPYTYMASFEYPQSSGEYGAWSTGAISGLRIEGKVYWFECGLDRCELVEMYKDDNGRVHEGHRET
jgi:hypothetical protein